ncbi:hypothetical protein [Microbulbifer sp. SSSA005]|uniref:hypothetical protein n=1 Tax=Microbulbifer sp. SSSA005 TaxID=3243378 RepID=UPI00403A04D5
MNKFLVVLALLICSPSGLASCWIEYTKKTLSERIEESNFTFRGEVQYRKAIVSQEKGHEERMESIEVLFDKVEDLNGNRIEKIYLKLDTACTCKYDFQVGVRYVVIGDKSGARISVQNCNNILTEQIYELHQKFELGGKG